MSTVVKQALSLSAEDRLELIEELWDSLVATPEAIPVSEAQRKALGTRNAGGAAETHNRPLKRPGMGAQADVEASGAGPSAPSRYTPRAASTGISSEAREGRI